MTQRELRGSTETLVIAALGIYKSALANKRPDLHDIEYQIVVQITDQFMKLINQYVKAETRRAKQRKRARVQPDA
jgi:chromatin segregation and condensation protein Rec8/ScpA/Scc1 (kleisin family)